MELVLAEQLAERTARLNHVEDAMARLRLGRSKIVDLPASMPTDAADVIAERRRQRRAHGTAG